MAPSKTMISALTSKSKNALIHVRVTRIWESINSKKNTIFHTNVVFVDEEESQIAAKVWNNQKDTYFPLLTVGSVYNISEFIIVAAAREYRPVDRDLGLTFYYKTNITPLPDTESIPKHKFNLIGFESVPQLLWKVENFIEVIGMVEAIGTSELTAKGARKTDVRLVDDRKQNLVVTLWEDKATQFSSSIATANGRAVFVVITGLLAKKYTTANVILSSGDGTITYCNIDYAPLNTLKAAIITATGQTEESLPPPATPRLMLPTADAMKQITVQEILETAAPMEDKVIRVLCEGTIVDISRYDNWFYNCCPKCPCAIQFDGDKLSCRLCEGPIKEYRQSYRVNVGVKDVSAKTTFTLFNKEVERLIGVPIEKLVDEIGKDNLGPETPPVLNNLIGKKCLFEVKITSKNTPGHEYYTVARLSETLGTDTVPAADTGHTQDNGEGRSSDVNQRSTKKQRIS